MPRAKNSRSSFIVRGFDLALLFHQWSELIARLSEFSFSSSGVVKASVEPLRFATTKSFIHVK